MKKIMTIDVASVKKSKQLLRSIGKWIQTSRSEVMDQQELATRVGLGRNTISAIENGKTVSSESLFQVLDQLDLIDDLQELIDNKLDRIGHKRSRKSRAEQPKSQVLNNDF